MSSLLDELSRNSLLTASLMGARASLEKHFSLADMLIGTSEQVKLEVQKRAGGSLKLPYSYMTLGEASISNEQTPNKNVRRLGYSVGNFADTKGKTLKAYLFPVLISLELHYVDSDPYSNLRMLEAFLIHSAAKDISFDIVLGETFHYKNTIEFPESTTIPISELNTPSNVGADITLSLVLHTYVGVVRYVSAVQNPTPVFDVRSVTTAPDYLPE